MYLLIFYLATMPIDVVKVRLQMQGADGTRQYSGILDAGAKTVKNEGIKGLWKGLPPALVRQVCCFLSQCAYPHSFIPDVLRWHEV